MRARGFLASGLVVVLGVSLGLVAPLGASADERELQGRSSATVSGTPKQILATVPAVAPLATGYKPGLFLPTNALNQRDKRGCTLRNQLLIKMAVQKPKVSGRNCALRGGAWLVDFGTKRVTKANQVRLAKLLPDKYVYAQGAYGWTPEQRRVFATTVQAPAKATRGSSFTPINSSLYQPVTPQSLPWMTRMLGTLDKISALGGTSVVPDAVIGEAQRQPSGPEAELEALKRSNPEFFKNWTLATLMNAKSWGLSMAPMVKNDFEVTIEECSADASKGNVCNETLTFTNEAARYKITVVPSLASTRPAYTSEPLRGYGSPTGPVIDRHLFGMHAPADWESDLDSGFEGPTEPATIPNVPVGYLRLWDTETTWRDIEPEKGRFVWRKLERQIQSAQVLDAKVMFVLGGTPAWAGDGSAASAPRSVAEWRAYVKEVACRFPNSISAYEIWNEANLQTFWTGSPEQMADLTLAAFEEIRACSPNALVVAASTTTRASGSFATFFPAYLEELKKRNWPADAYAVHSYPTASGGSEARIQGVGQFRTMLALAGAPFTTVFDTEVNYGLAGLGEGKRDITGSDAMTLLSRTYIDSARYGFGSTFWYVWTAEPDNKFGIQFTPAASAEQRAWRTTYDWLVGAQYQRCFGTDQQLTVCQFNKGGENFSIVWRGDVGSSAVAMPAGYLSGFGSRSCDLFGNCDVMTKATRLTIGPMPIRIDGPPSGDGSVTPTEPAPGEAPEGEAMNPPIIADVSIVYAPSNKADATARWVRRLDPGNVTIDRYEYEWRFCSGGSCERVIGGTTGPNTFQTSVDLPNGPGTYEFAVRARGSYISDTGSRLTSTSEFATERFTQLTSRAAPPSDVLVAVRRDQGQVQWTSPAIQRGKAPRYEVQIRNLSTNGPWVTFKAAAKGLNFPASDIKLKLGQTVQARVRTVLQDGQTSVFVASNEFRYVATPAPPILTHAFVFDARALEVYAMNRDPVGFGFPRSGYQVRLYNVQNDTWELLEYAGGSGPDPSLSSTRTIFPFGFMNRATTQQRINEGADLTLEMRSVDGTDRLPSEWITVPVKD